MQSLIDCNIDHQSSYWNDEYTTKATQVLKKEFWETAQVFFTYNGTWANVLALKAITKPYESIICSQSAHIHANETWAPEMIIWSKLQLVPSSDGKITIEWISAIIEVQKENGIHSSKPWVISITQCTEYGTVYTIDEIKAITNFAHQHWLLVHMDGCRIYNAVAHLRCSLKEITTDAGIDILSLWWTKNGLMFGEAVILLNDTLWSLGLEYLQKQCLQLHSKMRFISAQFIALFANNLRLENASHANSMAKLLEKWLLELHITLTQKVQSNHIFAILPNNIIKPLQDKFPFYIWDIFTNEVRFVTSFDTTESEIRLFLDEIKTLIN